MRIPLWYRRLTIFLPVLFAHKPICTSFRKDLFCVKGIYLCRSCCFLVLGFSSSIISVIFLELTFYKQYIYLSIFVSLIIFIFSHPRLYDQLRRPIKDWLRFFLGWTLANFLFLLIFKKLFLFLVSAAFLWILRIIYSGIRSKMKDKACDKCEEFHEDKLCSGFLPKAKLMKKYEDQVCEALNKIK